MEQRIIKKRMREAFNNQNQPKSKNQTKHPNSSQLSQRSGAHPSSHHQKTNSVGNKALMPSQNLNLALEEQNHQLLHGQVIGNSHFHQSLSTLYFLMFYAIDIGAASKVSHLQVTGASQGSQISTSNHHKKSNSMVNAKMAQIILKGPNQTANIGGHTLASQLNQHILQPQQNPVNNNMMMQSHNNQQHMMNQQHQANMNAMIQASKGVSFQHPNQSLTGSMVMPQGSLVLGPLATTQQTSFQLHNELPSYSIDYTKQPNFQEDLEDVSNQSTQLLLQQNQQQFLMSQASSKQHLQHTNLHKLTQPLVQPIPIDVLSDNQTILKKSSIITGHKPQNNLNIYQGTQKQINVATAVQKSTKKVASSHQRTKSDTQYNRATINIKSSTQAGSQSKRSGPNQSNVRINFIEVDNNSRQAAQHPNYHKQSGIQTLNENIINSLGPRKAPNSANHSKKPSLNQNTMLQTYHPNQQTIHPGNIQNINNYQNLHQQIQQVQQTQPHSKKSTKEKYIELKSMYDELLEKHYMQQQQFQQQQQQLASNKFPQSVSNNNLIGLYNPQSQQPQISHLISGANQFDQQLSTTPRMIIQNQLSQSALNQNSIHMFLNQGQLDIKPNQPIKTTQKSIAVKQNEQLNPKTVVKLQVSQGQSRKNAQGNHKRSVSDGNDQLFKFKQQQMQKYLYPQPSNQLIQSTSPMNQLNQQIIGMVNPPLGETDDVVSDRHKAGLTIGGSQTSNSNIGPTPYQAPSHQRRVSDDYIQKQKRINAQTQGQNTTSKKQLLQTSQAQENVASDQTNDSVKLHTIDFNIKSFLLDMRNKQQTSGGGFITVIDEQQQMSQTSPINMNQVVPPPNSNMHTNQQPQNKNQRINNKNGKHFAMIIEENSPRENIGQTSIMVNKPKPNVKLNSDVLQSPRKGSLLPDSQSQQALSQQTSKPIIDFSKLQNKQQKQIDRSQSPSLDFDKQLQNPIKNKLAQVSHKRVKSDVTEPSVISEPITSNIYVKHNNPMILQAQVLSKQQKKQQNYLHGQPGVVSISDKNTPTKQKSQKILIPGNLVKKQTQQQQQKYLLSQQLGGSIGSQNNDGKKIVNVSIELMKDAMDRSGIDESNYIDSNQNLHWVPDMTEREPATHKIIGEFSERQSVQPFDKIKQNLSGGSGMDSKKEKYKKMKDKYKQVVGGINNSPRHEQFKHPKHNRKYTFDMGAASAIKNSNSPSPSNVNISPKGRLSINERANDGYKKQQSSKAFNQTSPKSMYPKQKIKVQNLMIQPSSRKQSDTEPKDIISKNIQSPKNQPPNNSVVQTQESPRLSQLIVAPLVSQVSERIETQDSDIGLSPRSRAISKLVKHIRLSFRQTRQPPNTTVDFYRIGKVLGKGAFGKVNLALHKLIGRFAAVKSINKQYLSEDAQTKKVMQEVVILKRTRHRNIVRLYEFFETQKHILFVIELCAGGDLLNYVRKRRRLKEDVAKCIFKQIIEGLAYCHSKSILHRDIKLDNILLDSEGEVKICDFGVSKIVKQGEIMTEQCGTPAYIAPEILRDKGYQGFSVDIWSAGVVLYAMLYGTVPFKANNMSELQKLIIKAKYTLKEDGVSEEARSLLTGLLEKDPAKRMTVPQILSHKWLIDANDKMELFTDQEREYIKNEFTYNDTERYNRNDDPFTDHMLDSTNNSMLKNNETKSVILAPFNSTKSDINAKAITEDMKVLIQSKGCIKFAPRCREIDKQYENNNNADLDNGVYHKQEEENEQKKDEKMNNSQDSLQSSFNKQSSLKSDEDDEQLRIQQKIEKQGKLRKEKQTELEKLESLICQKEEEAGDDPYQQSQTKAKDLMTMLESQQTLMIDEKAVGLIEIMGYSKEFVIKSLNNNDLNYATTGYFLLVNQHALTFKGVTALTLLR